MNNVKVLIKIVKLIKYNEYDFLGNLKPRGPSPLSAGLLLSLAVVRSISKTIYKSIA